MTLSPAVETTWPERAAALADELAEQGKLTDPAWRAAVAAVPRHRLVPKFWTQDPTGTWQETDTTSTPPQDWLDPVYTNRVLVSALTGAGAAARVRSSSTQPGLMIRMLEALQIADGQRVLEIGPGTGYNAALLCHRLGDRTVYSIDVEPDLVATARARLAELGYTPILATGDGAYGLPEHAPFDRIIATCAVPTIPWPWVDQLVDGGQLLTDLKIAHAAGSLVKLTRVADDRAGCRARRDRRRTAPAVAHGRARPRNVAASRPAGVGPLRPVRHPRPTGRLARRRQNRTMLGALRPPLRQL